MFFPFSRHEAEKPHVAPICAKFSGYAGFAVLIAFLFLHAMPGIAAMPAKISESGLAHMENGALDDAGNEQTQKQAAATIISGSPWPGVIDHLLQKPLPEDDATGKANIHIKYPSIGNRYIDADIRAWVGEIANAFESHLNLSSNEDLMLPEEIENEAGIFLQDNDLNSEEAFKIAKTPGEFELWGNYSVSRPSDAAVSITFELWNYAGNPQGNLDILTLNYNLLAGQRLSFVDIFEKPEKALELMSAWSRKQLEPRLGASMRSRMLQVGTEPLVENFSSLTLTPEGVCINFQPWQVAQWDAGIQKVNMPLEELLDASPLLALWGKPEPVQ